MKNVDSKLLLGLVVGAAVGAAVGYLAATDKREQLLEELNGVVGKVKAGKALTLTVLDLAKLQPLAVKVSV